MGIQVSIIIVNYNDSTMLDECINSIKLYTKNVAYEIIVVDNNSSDSINIVIQKTPDVHFILNKENMGFSHANNQGLEIATGEWTLILNNDTLFTENTIKILLDNYNSYSGNDFIGCKLLNRDGSHQISYCSFETPFHTVSSNLFLYQLFPRSPFFNKFHMSHEVITEPREVDYIIGAFILCKTRTLKNLKGFDERFYFYAEEIDLCRRHKSQGGKVIYFPNTAIYHHAGATTDTMPYFKYKNQAIAYIQYYQKYFHGLSFFIAIFFHYLGLVIRIPIFLFSGLIFLKKSYIKRSFFHFRQLFIYPKNQFRSLTE